MTITTSVNPSDAIGKSVEPIKGMLQFLMQYWWVFVLLLFLGIAIFLVFYLIKLREKEHKEHDSEAYTLYNDILNGCEINCDKKLIKKTYSLINLLWLGIPIKKNEHSMKIRNIDHELIGYYRGYFLSLDGYHNYLLYKTKSFGLIEKRFILRFPKGVKHKVVTGKGKNEKITSEYTDTDNQLIEKINGSNDIRLMCIGVQKLGLYYYSPVFVCGINRTPIDLRSIFEESIADETNRVAYQRLLGINVKNMRKAVSGNPVTQFNKQTVAEIEQQNEEIDAEEDNSRG